MKSQIPENVSNQRCDPRFSSGRGRGRGQIYSSMTSGPGRGGAYRTRGLRQIDGRGGEHINNFLPMGRGPSHKAFGRGRTRNFHQQHPPFHRNKTNLQPHNNNFPHGPSMLRGGPSPGMMARGRPNTGYNSFNDGRGRGGRNNIRPPPPPPRGRSVGQTIIYPPPPPPPQGAPQSLGVGVQLGQTQTRNLGSLPFQKELRSLPPSYGIVPGQTPGIIRGNLVRQPQNIYHQQRHGPLATKSTALTSLPHQQLHPDQQPQSKATNHTIYIGQQQDTNPPHKSYDQVQFQQGHTGTFQNNSHQQPPSMTTPSNNSVSTSAPPPPAQQIEEAWKEYTAPGGVKYYHNVLLKESTYQKPEALKKKELVNPSNSNPMTPTASSSQKRPWQEHEDTSTGRKYYSNGMQTTWEKPEGFVSAETIVANTSFSKRDEQSIREGSAKKKKRTSNSAKSLTGDSVGKNNDFANKKEATTAFKGFLLAKGVSPSLKWNEVLKICESDSRWDSYEEALSLGERRQALAEFQTKRTNEIRNEQRQERIRAKEAFGQLLADVLPSVSGFSARLSRFSDVRSALSKDDRFFAVEDESNRESLFLDFCDDFKKREERSKRNKKREAQESFISFLQEREEAGSLTYASTWESFLLSLSEEDKVDSRFVTSKTFNDSDRQLSFADFVIELQKVEDDKRRRIQDARRRAEKAQRDQYRELLHQMATDGKILPYSRWREIEEFLAKKDSFKLVEGQDRDTPREIFELFVDEWDETYRRERNFLSRLLHPHGRPDVVISAGTTYENFKKIITEEAAYSPDIQNETFRIVNRDDPISSARLLFDELISQTVDVSRYGGSRKGSAKDDSSEDEGEIIEDGEVIDSDCREPKSNELQ